MRSTYVAQLHQSINCLTIQSVLSLVLSDILLAQALKWSPLEEDRRRGRTSRVAVAVVEHGLVLILPLNNTIARVPPQ